MRFLTTLLIITILIFAYHFSSGQQPISTTKKTDSMKGNKKELQEQTEQVIDTMGQQTINSPKPTDNMKSSKKELREQIEQATSTINFLNSNITAIGIFLGIYLLILGLAVYVFGIKPSQDAIDKLEKNMDARISAYLENDRLNHVDIAIDSLDSHTELRRTMSLQFLAGQSIAQPLTDAQCLKIFSLAKDSKYDDIRLGATSLLFRVDQNSSIYPLVDEYFMQVMNNDYTLNEDKSALSTVVRQHLSKIPMSNQKILQIQELAMEHADQPYYMIHNIFNLYKSKELFILIANSPSIAESYFRPTNQYDIKQLVKRDGESSLSIFLEKFTKLGGTQQEFEQTLLVKRIRKYIEITQ